MSLFLPKRPTKSEALSYLKVTKFVLPLIFWRIFNRLILQVILDLYLPDQKRFSRTINLFGNVDANNSTFQFFGTKVSHRQIEILVYLLDSSHRLNYIFKKAMAECGQY